MENQEIVTAIKWHRENLEIKSKDVAAMLGHIPSKYSKIENGEQVITGAELVNIANFFKMTVDEIIRIPKKNKE